MPNVKARADAVILHITGARIVRSRVGKIKVPTACRDFVPTAFKMLRGVVWLFGNYRARISSLTGYILHVVVNIYAQAGIGAEFAHYGRHEHFVVL